MFLPRHHILNHRSDVRISCVTSVLISSPYMYSVFILPFTRSLDAPTARHTHAHSHSLAPVNFVAPIKVSTLGFCVQQRLLLLHSEVVHNGRCHRMCAGFPKPRVNIRLCRASLSVTGSLCFITSHCLFSLSLRPKTVMYRTRRKSPGCT